MDNENSAVLYKETLFDKIFRPQVITLENGHTVRRRRSRTPLILLILALVIWDKNGALAEKTSFQRSLFGFAQISEGISHRKERHLYP